MYTQIGLGYNQKHKLSYEEVLMMKVVKYGLSNLRGEFLGLALGGVSPPRKEPRMEYGNRAQFGQLILCMK